MQDFRSLLKYCRPYVFNVLMNIVFNLLSAVFLFFFLMLIPFDLIFHADTLVGKTPAEVVFNINNLKGVF